MRFVRSRLKLCTEAKLSLRLNAMVWNILVIQTSQSAVRMFEYFSWFYCTLSADEWLYLLIEVHVLRLISCGSSVLIKNINSVQVELVSTAMNALEYNFTEINCIQPL